MKLQIPVWVKGSIVSWWYEGCRSHYTLEVAHRLAVHRWMEHDGQHHFEHHENILFTRHDFQVHLPDTDWQFGSDHWAGYIWGHKLQKVWIISKVESDFITCIIYLHHYLEIIYWVCSLSWFILVLYGEASDEELWSVHVSSFYYLLTTYRLCLHYKHSTQCISAH